MSCTAARSGQLLRLVGGLVLTAASAVGPISYAASPSDTSGKVNRLIDVSGMAHTVRQVNPNIVLGLDEPQQGQGIPANVRSALRDAATQAFQPDPMIVRIRSHLRTALTDRQLDDTLAWLDGALGRRITALENAAAEPAAMQQVQVYARELKDRLPPQRRMNLVGELNVATGSAELNASILEAVILASALGFNAAQPVQSQVPADVLRGRIKSGLPRLRQQSDQLVMLSLLYTYRSLSDRDLEAYLKFLKSPSGSAYSKGALGAFREAMLEATGRFMLAIPKALGKHKGTAGA